MHRVAILVGDRVATFELACALEVFALSRPEYPQWYQSEVVSFYTDKVVGTAGMGLSVTRINSLQDFDSVVIPSWDIHQRKVLLSMAMALRDFAAEGKRIISFCSGSFLPAQLGLLDGKSATTHWQYAEVFQQRFTQLHYCDNVLYTIDGNMACSAGSAAALDLSLEIVRRDYGYQVANQVARRLVISPHRCGGQAQYVETPVQEHYSGFADTLDWAKENLQQQLKVDDLARHANMSRRSFDRHFRASTGMSAKTWLNQQRVRLARQILESKSVGLEQLAEMVGFDNAITLRFNFNKFVGVSPSHYQSQFQPETG